jgi:pyruvate,water dikinase
MEHLTRELEAADASATTIRRAVDDLLEASELFEGIGIAVLYETTLYDRFRKWFGEDGYALASRLLQGLGNNENAGAGLALWGLARRANEHACVRAALIQEACFADARHRMVGNPDGDAFLEAWDAFMEAHGHHCRGELELFNPRWSETPDAILEQLRSYLDTEPEQDLLARHRRLAKTRAEALVECRRRLRNPIKRALLSFLVSKTRRCSPLRENAKSRMVRCLAAVRRLLLDVGEAAWPGRSEDVFFLRLDELDRLDEDLAETIGRRRAEYERNRAVTPPPVVIGGFDPHRDAALPPADERTTLRGIGVNPGVVEGPARVVLREGSERVRPGEILVAPFTDPGWTPYFLNAAAIVVDMGGLLSHGSIVARELGIPAVVNVGPATRILSTGRRIRVDGARGLVTLLDTPEPGA